MRRNHEQRTGDGKKWLLEGNEPEDTNRQKDKAWYNNIILWDMGADHGMEGGGGGGKWGKVQVGWGEETMAAKEGEVRGSKG